MDSPATPNASIPRSRSSPAPADPQHHQQGPASNGTYPAQPYPSYPQQQQQPQGPSPPPNMPPQQGWTPSPTAQPFYPQFYPQGPAPPGAYGMHPHAAAALPPGAYFDPNAANAQFAWAYQQMMFNAAAQQQQAQMGQYPQMVRSFLDILDLSSHLSSSLSSFIPLPFSIHLLHHNSRTPQYRDLTTPTLVAHLAEGTLMAPLMVAAAAPHPPADLFLPAGTPPTTPASTLIGAPSARAPMRSRILRNRRHRSERPHR